MYPSDEMPIFQQRFVPRRGGAEAGAGEEAKPGRGSAWRSADRRAPSAAIAADSADGGRGRLAAAGAAAGL